MNVKAQYIDELNELMDAIKETRFYARHNESANDGKFSQEPTFDQISSAITPEGAAQKARELLTPRTAAEKSEVRMAFYCAFWERGDLWQKLDDLIKTAQKLISILKDEMKNVNEVLGQV